MTVSASNRSLKQLWSDLLVALGGSEAFLTRDLSERQVLIEILNTYGGSYSKRTIGGRENILASIVTAAGGVASPRHSRRELLATLTGALGGASPSPYSSSTEELIAAAVNAAADTGGGGGGDYVAKAVRFLGDGTHLFINAGGADTGKFLFSSWIADTGASGDASASPGQNDQIFLASYPSNMIEYAELAVNPPSQLFATFNENSSFVNRLTLTSVDNLYPFVGYSHIAVSVDMNHADPNKRKQIYVNGLPISTTTDYGAGNAATNGLISQLSLESALYIGTDGYFQFGVFSCAELQWWQDVSGDLSDPAVIGKLISGGKPVDPATAAASFGTQTVLGSGDATGFATNLGTLGAASVRRAFNCTGSNGAGPVTLSEALVGQPVYRVMTEDTFSDVTSEFEATVSVDGQVQQTSATDYSATTLQIVLPGTLTNATTSPSD